MSLDYHARGRPGKLEVVTTKPTRTQLDLSLAYTPGVATPVHGLQRGDEVREIVNIAALAVVDAQERAAE